MSQPHEGLAHPSLGIQGANRGVCDKAIRKGGETISSRPEVLITCYKSTTVGVFSEICDASDFAKVELVSVIAITQM